MSLAPSSVAGYYIYIEASANRANNLKVGDVARIATKQAITPSASGSCVQWWYHMYGASVNQLSLKIVSSVSAGMLVDCPPIPSYLCR